MVKLQHKPVVVVTVPSVPMTEYKKNEEVDAIYERIKDLLDKETANLPNRYSAQSGSLWRMRRHGPVTALCTDLEDFPMRPG